MTFLTFAAKRTPWLIHERWISHEWALILLSAVSPKTPCQTNCRNQQQSCLTPYRYLLYILIPLTRQGLLIPLIVVILSFIVLRIFKNKTSKILWLYSLQSLKCSCNLLYCGSSLIIPYSTKVSIFLFHIACDGSRRLSYVVHGRW